MIISRVMTKNPIFVYPDLSVNEARALMGKEKIGRLPVLDKNNKLVGIVTKKDLLKAGPSAATSLDMYEISYLLSKLKVKEIMEKKVITVDENELVEEAARIMADNDISCLPVMRDSECGPLLVGIITGTDLFHVFINAFGARHAGVRITVNIGERPGQLAKLAGAIAEKGGNLVAFVSSEGDDLSRRRATLKITGVSRAEVEAVIKTVPDAVLEDIRE
ncbi:MAG: CBS and ACT domain-containing protein [Treponema sp.]|jgi:acetoin utilization protein AcuB|nr:CBS and ACT domain-containing protein [Treponema sp.]